MNHYYDPKNAMLIESCASVGISRGKSTQEMIVIYLSGYHNRGHKEI